MKRELAGHNCQPSDQNKLSGSEGELAPDNKNDAAWSERSPQNADSARQRLGNIPMEPDSQQAPSGGFNAPHSRGISVLQRLTLEQSPCHGQMQAKKFLICRFQRPARSFRGRVHLGGTTRLYGLMTGCTDSRNNYLLFLLSALRRLWSKSV